VTPITETPEGIAPLLRKLMADYVATGLPPAYLPTPAPEEPSS
jgi:putative transposase